MTRPIDSDKFAASIEDILKRVGGGVREVTPKIVQTGTRTAAKLWRESIKENFDESRTYRKHGKTYQIGAYRKSIRSHMLSKSYAHPQGEVGAPKMSGLPHLLENGHARIGGGRVNGIIHVEPAAEEAFQLTVEEAERAIEEVLDDI